MDQPDQGEETAGFDLILSTLCSGNADYTRPPAEYSDVCSISDSSLESSSDSSCETSSFDSSSEVNSGSESHSGESVHEENVSDNDSSDNDMEGDECSQEPALYLYTGSDITVDEAVYDVLNDYVKHNESQSSLASHLKTFLKYLPKPNNMPNSVPRLFRYLEKMDPSFKENSHAYCSKYLLPFEEPHESDTEEPCETVCEACGSKEQAVFYSFNVENQMKNLLENCGLAEDLDKVIALRNSSDQDSSFVRDITDGTEYRKLNVSGYSVTLMWFTDGVKIKHSSHKELQPIEFVICELPPHSRKLYTGVCGVWYDRKQPVMNSFLEPFSKHLQEVNIRGGFEWTHPKTGV